MVAVLDNQFKNTLYISGQIGLDPQTMQMVGDDFSQQAEQAIKNLQAIVQAAGGELMDIMKLTVFLTGLDQCEVLNTVMQKYFKPPFPVRALAEVARLPKDAQIEIKAVALLG